MYGFDVGMHVGENLAQIEKKERAEAQARAKARAAAKAEAQAQVAQIKVEAPSSPAPAQAQASSQPQTQSQSKMQKSKPGPIMMPFNAFQAHQMQKATPGNARPPTAKRPDGPNRTVSFPTFPSNLQKPSMPSMPGGGLGSGLGSGLSSLAHSAYNSPLPSPGLPGPGKSPWFPFGPKSDSGDSRCSSPK